MLLHDRVAVISREEVGWDDLGLPIYEDTETMVPAQVDPSTTTAGDDPNTAQVTSRYRVLMEPPAGLDLNGVEEVVWRGTTIRVDGAIQPQMIRGRVHHYEFVSEQVTG